MVISKPCEHPDYPAKNGLVRGYYESIEFIREIPRSKKSLSSTDLRKIEAESKAVDDKAVALTDVPNSTGRNRGKTIGFAESRGFGAKGESIDLQNEPQNVADEDVNPVEWIMISRSDPGGSVPRFLVERGTPAGIVSDASKFLDWAVKREPSTATESSEQILEETPKAITSHSRSEEQSGKLCAIRSA